MFDALPASIEGVGVRRELNLCFVLLAQRVLRKQRKHREHTTDLEAL